MPAPRPGSEPARPRDRPDPHLEPADEVIRGQRAPDVAIVAVVPIVAEHEVFVGPQRQWIQGVFHGTDEVGLLDELAIDRQIAPASLRPSLREGP